MITDGSNSVEMHEVESLDSARTDRDYEAIAKKLKARNFAVMVYLSIMGLCIGIVSASLYGAGQIEGLTQTGIVFTLIAFVAIAVRTENEAKMTDCILEIKDAVDFRQRTGNAFFLRSIEKECLKHTERYKNKGFTGSTPFFVGFLLVLTALMIASVVFSSSELMRFLEYGLNVLFKGAPEGLNLASQNGVSSFGLMNELFVSAIAFLMGITAVRAFKVSFVVCPLLYVQSSFFVTYLTMKYTEVKPVVWDLKYLSYEAIPLVMAFTVIVYLLFVLPKNKSIDKYFSPLDN